MKLSWIIVRKIQYRLEDKVDLSENNIKSWKRGKKRWENKIINPKEPISEQFKFQNEKTKEKWNGRQR